MIFPSDNDDQNKLYETFVHKANELWDDFTTGGRSKKGAPEVIVSGKSQKPNGNANGFTRQNTTIGKKPTTLSAQPKRIVIEKTHINHITTDVAKQ